MTWKQSGLNESWGGETHIWLYCVQDTVIIVIPSCLSCLETTSCFWPTGSDYSSIWKKLADGGKSPKQSLDVLFSVFLTFQITVVTLNRMERYGPRPENKALSLVEVWLSWMACCQTLSELPRLEDSSKLRSLASVSHRAVWEVGLAGIGSLLALGSLFKLRLCPVTLKSLRSLLLDF